MRLERDLRRTNGYAEISVRENKWRLGRRSENCWMDDEVQGAISE